MPRCVTSSHRDSPSATPEPLDMDRLLAPLNDAQRAAVQHVEGPLLILAGPGSGKTRVVTSRIACLMEQGISPREILALTFTNKAASEMRKRVDLLAPGQGVWVSTFHRFGARLLREYGSYVGLAPHFTIYDTSDSRQVLKRVIESQKVGTLHYSVDQVASAISNAKNKLLTPETYHARTGSPLSSIVAQVYPAYQERLLQSAAVDFDDLLMLVAQVLYQNEELRAELDRRFRYVLVDEYQDTNKAQYVILRALSVDFPNLAATGDPDQSIYGWRGADISNILEFERDFPSVRVVRLEQNYRSTKKILRIADALIAHNKRRKKKSLFTDNPEGQSVRLTVYATQDIEAAEIASEIRESIAKGTRRASDYAIFYRVNALSRTLERALRAAGVPYQLIRGQEFYQRKEIKDLLAYCQLANNPQDDVAFERAVNSPARGVGKKSLERLGEHAYQRATSLLDAARDGTAVPGLPKRAGTQLAKFVAIIDKVTSIAAGPVEAVVGTVISESGYTEALKNSDDEEDLSRLANIQELLTDARAFDEQAEEGEGLEAYLERTWLVNETDNWDTESDQVTMMTLHAAKGLEFPVVYLVALEDGILPHERTSRDPDQLEEERRLAFVGITRAREELRLSCVSRRDFRGQRRIVIPSSFLMEIPREELDIRQLVPDEFEEEYVPDDIYQGEVDVTFDVDQFEREKAAPPASNWRVAAASITTAASLAGETGKGPTGPKVSPDVFTHGMTVVHPEFGPGKITALSGSGTARKATVQFAKAGERRFVLVHSPLRPANGG
jgi:DNA helicase-2/ATP-dependent DNA helicase PcrA